MRGVITAGFLLASGLALGQQRFDHRGSLGLTVAVGGEFVTAVSSMATGENGLRIPLELGGTLAVTDHTELRLARRASLPASRPSPPWPVRSTRASATASASTSCKTFFDLELAVHPAPFFAIGVRAAFGVQYDFLPIMGVYAQLGGQLGAARPRCGSRSSCIVGVQFRTYLFE